MVKVIRQTNSTYCVIDYIYIDDKYKFMQSNSSSRNRFGAKKYKTNGKILNIDLWERM